MGADACVQVRKWSMGKKEAFRTKVFDKLTYDTGWILNMLENIEAYNGIEEIRRTFGEI